MQLASITFDGEKKVDAFIIPPTYFKWLPIADKTKATEQIAVTVIPVEHSGNWSWKEPE
jgi:hypothetical protein